MQLSDFPELFCSSSTFCRPFDGLDTLRSQLSFYKNHLNFIVSYNGLENLLQFMIECFLEPVRIPLGT